MDASPEENAVAAGVLDAPEAAAALASTRMPEREAGKPPASPRPGDFILAYPPHPAEPDKPGQYAVPCLIVSIETREHLDGATIPVAIQAALSKKTRLDRLYPGEFAMTDPAKLEAAGLRGARKFDLAAPVRLPWDRNFIIFRAGSEGPVLGRLSDEDRQAAATLREEGRRMLARARSAPPAVMPPCPIAGDVIYAFVPFAERPYEPGPKARPCIVIEARQEADGRTALLVAQGTTQMRRESRPQDLMIEDEPAMARLGLRCPGRFVMDDIRLIYWDQSYASFADHGPVIGRLGPVEMKRAGAAIEAAGGAIKTVAPLAQPPVTSTRDAEASL